MPVYPGALRIADNTPGIVEILCNIHINLLIARCPTKELQPAQKMETFGFLLMDTLVYYSFDLKKRTIPDDTIRAHAGQGQDPLLLGKCNRPGYRARAIAVLHRA